MGDQLLRGEEAYKRPSRGFARSREGQNVRNVGSYVGCSGYSGLIMLSASYSGFPEADIPLPWDGNLVRPAGRSDKEPISRGARGSTRDP